MRFSQIVRIQCVLNFVYLTTMALAVSLSRHGCRDKCGNVTIPFPFGIGSHCYANSSFAVNCNNSVPILSGINMEALSISLETGIVTVKFPVSPMKCSSKVRTESLGASLMGSPFTVSESYNSMFVLGCQNAAWLRVNQTSASGGCMAICDANSTHTSCTGVNCCQTQIPKGLKVLEVTYRSIDISSNASGFCGYVLLAEQKWIHQEYKTHKRLMHNLLNPFDENLRYTTMALEWDLSKNSFSPYSTSGCHAGTHYSDYYGMKKYKSCTCAEGFEGNPYLLNGCKDIDECTNSTLNRCQRIGYPCINMIGSYECEYPWLKDDHKSRVLKTVFIVVGSVIGTLIMLLVFGRVSKIFWKRFKANRKLKRFKRNGGLILERHLSAVDSGMEKVKMFRSKDLAQATDRYNENRVLGRGGQGTVYKGMLTDGRIVAVKKSVKIDECDVETFINEVVILSNINHRNVVKLIGCCLETEIPLLVYEFIPNGTLFKHIHHPNEEFPLTWEMRVRIATEVASCLSYLHSASSTPVYHRDIKSTNILLDDKYRAKVSDFGTSRSFSIDQTHLTTRVLGTFGYLDPEYFQSSQFTEKSDVYSFGVVMVELLTGEKAISCVIRGEGGRSLATHFLQSMEENVLLDIVDARVLKEGRKEEIMGIAQIARRCLHLNGKRRPTMKEVTAKLEAILNSKEEEALLQDMINEDKLGSNLFDHSDFDDFSLIPEVTHLHSITISRSSSDVHPLLIDEP